MGWIVDRRGSVVRRSRELREIGRQLLVIAACEEALSK